MLVQTGTKTYNKKETRYFLRVSADRLKELLLMNITIPNSTYEKGNSPVT